MKAHLLIFSAILVCSTPAMAQMGQLDVFENADTDGDGQVSQAEFRAARAQQFSRLDRNGDGTVAQSDFGRIAQMRPQLGARLNAFIASADTNRDGRVTRAEFGSAPTPLFERADANRNGLVDKAELDRLREAIRRES